MSSDLTSKEVADRIGVSMSTLKNWAVRLPVPSVLGADGTRRFPEEALAVLEAVKQLRDEERSYATIRRAILAPDEERDALPEEAAAPPAPEAAILDAAVADAPAETAGPEAPAAPALEVTVTLADPEPRPEGPTSEATMALVTQVVQLIREETAMAEAYAAARQRVGELEAQVKMLHEDKLRLQAELADARVAAAPREVHWARRPWYRRLQDYLFP